MNWNNTAFQAVGRCRPFQVHTALRDLFFRPLNALSWEVSPWACRSNHSKYYSPCGFLTFPPIRTWAWSLASFSWFIALCLKNEVQIQVNYQNIKRKKHWNNASKYTNNNNNKIWGTHYLNTTKQPCRRSTCTTMMQTNTTFDVASVRGRICKFPSLSMSAHCWTHLATDSDQNQHGPPQGTHLCAAQSPGRGSPESSDVLLPNNKPMTDPRS